ncbi:peptidoglycan-binding domain-containing protein [Kitasatospora sp. NPDC003701]
MKLNTKSVLRKGAATTVAAFLLVGIGASTASAKPGLRNVSYGDRTAAATCIQLALNNYNSQRSFPHPEMALDVDGQFGDDTLRVLKAFQRANGVAADGIVGPMTGHLLYWGYLSTTDPYCWSVLPTRN